MKTYTFTKKFQIPGHFLSSEYCDVTLSTLDGAGRVLPAHRVVLAAASAKLEKRLDSAREESGPVVVRNIRFEVLKKIKEMIYSGKVEVEEADYEDIQDAVDMLRVSVPVEFNFDEERYLFEFDPFSEYFDLKDPSEIVTMTYQSLVQIAEMKKRSSSVTTPEDSSKLHSYTVWKMLRILRGEEAVLQFGEKVEQIVKYLKKVLLDILESCLAPSLPYPVICTIHSHLLDTKGLARLGQVSKDDTSNKVVVELDYMDKLYLAMAEVFDHLKIIMFHIEPNTLATEASFTEKNDVLFERFELLSSVVDAAKLERDFDGLEIAEDETVSEVEKSGENMKDD